MINPGLFSSNTPEWATPKAFFDALDAEFHFDLDPCSTPENAKCGRFFTKDDDGLSKSWGGVKSLLQPAIRQRTRQVGAEVLRGVAQAGHACCHAHTGQN